MVRFFPRQTVEWHLHEPAVLRRFSLSLVGMAVLAGVLVRLYRLLLLSFAPSSFWLLLGGITGGALILLGTATAHLGNYPVRHWLWRAPVFALVAAAAEVATSAALIAAGVERMGTGVMHWHDWQADLMRTIVWRFGLVSIFALVLGAVVQGVRLFLVRRDRREHTMHAMHHEPTRHP